MTVVQYLCFFPLFSYHLAHLIIWDFHKKLRALVTLWWHLFFSIIVVTFHWLLLLSQTCFLSTPRKSNPYVNLSAFYYFHLDIIYCVYWADFLLWSPQCRQKLIQTQNYSNNTLLQKAACSYKTHPKWIPLVNSAMRVVSEENP